MFQTYLQLTALVVNSLSGTARETSKESFLRRWPPQDICWAMRTVFLQADVCTHPTACNSTGVSQQLLCGSQFGLSGRWVPLYWYWLTGRSCDTHVTSHDPTPQSPQILWFMDKNQTERRFWNYGSWNLRWVQASVASFPGPTHLPLIHCSISSKLQNCYLVE